MYRVGVTLLNREHRFYNVLEETLKTEGEARGMTVIIQDGDFDSIKQKNQIEDFIAQEVDAIAVSYTHLPRDRLALSRFRFVTSTSTTQASPRCV